MATGAGLGGLLTAVLPLIGLVTILRGRSRRKRGNPEPLDQDFEARRAAAQESERRMAAYLASRDRQSWHDDDA